MKNKTVLITGASAGIGQAVAFDCSKLQAHLILVARRVDRLKSIQKKCLQLGAQSVQIFKLDVQDTKEIQNFCKTNKKILKTVDILINNAGLAKGTERFQDAQPDDWDQMLDTNVRGLLYLTRGLIAPLIKNQGHIVNMGSVAGRLVYEGGSVYCASKFAVRAISDGLRMDLKGTNVRVTNIEPGMVNTEFSLVRLGNQQKAKAVYDDMTPLSAEDISETILWCLQRPSHVNIQELVIYPTDQASVGQVVRKGK
ncbi:MAG: NAD(P)-dependent oxidoreductase [Bdellovibrionales bacterium RIFCSPHIGHO2_01_FULL_40_29]|nr:MAG: NAD(P)-dependent oxidoreductase [Bdellovibrionales bacterium RIFCSPHIGHO2_01_FULL_40_29]OFZ32493.1 MAG: NAD(P)-dependent oxidoreductase [Bdellovibrionales bacterium RIFCSPHIGHO2_02_FULL_40_15]